MNKPCTFIVICLILSQICKGQENATKQDTALQTEFFDKEFQWKIFIPKGFDTVSSKVYKALQSQGIKDLGKAANKNFEADTVASRICAYQNGGMFNYFEANEETFDPKINGDFFAHCKQNDDYIYADYRKIVFPNIKIDITVTNEIIDGYIFQKFQLHIGFGNNSELNMFVYSRLFNRREFTFVIVFSTEKKGI